MRNLHARYCSNVSFFFQYRLQIELYIICIMQKKWRVPWNCVVFPIISQVRDPPLGNRCTKVYFFLAFVVGRHSVTFFYIFHPLFVSPRGIICGFWTSKMRHIVHISLDLVKKMEKTWPLFHHKCQMRTMNKLQLMLPTFAFSKRILTCL